MDKQQAQNLIKTTFESRFDADRFTAFIKNLLNQFDVINRSYQGNYIPDAYKPFIRRYSRIGKYDDGENRIDILVVYLNKETSIERARTSQRNFIAGYLNGKYGSTTNKDAALVAFVAPDEADWRFSLVKMEYRFVQGKDGGIKVKEEFTPARRWSFLVGESEASHTAQSRIVPILADDEHKPTLAQLEEAFNIETVTKEFFLEYRMLFIRTKEALDAVVENDTRIKSDFAANGVNTVDFSKKLMGQIVFLYFLQKKGWFGVARDAEWGARSKKFLRELFEGRHGAHRNFFNDILEPLFYEALRMDRIHDDDYYSRFNCKIPFLNGGLFDPIANYDWVHTDILLPNALFSNQNRTKDGDTGDGILDIFDRYNFTVREDEPLEREVAIDPELLGKAYEKFNAIRPDNFEEYKAALKSGNKGAENKFNKKFGVYYTPREIVHYMCRQSLIHYLDTTLNKAVVTHEVLGTSQYKMFGNEIKTGQLDLTIEHRPNQIVQKKDLETLIQSGEQLGEHEATVAAKGRETGTYAHKLSESIRKNVRRIDAALAGITVCDPAIGSGAFPVGMMNEIVKARNVLSTYISDDDKTPGGTKFWAPANASSDRTLYHFKRECIEKSLYGVDIDAGAVEIAKLRLWLSLMVDEEDIRQIKPLPNLDYKIMCGNSLLGFPENFRSSISNEIENLQHVYFSETTPGKKRTLRGEIDQKIGERYQSSKAILGYEVHFDFRTVFPEVFRRKGGFDVMIANPPYVRQEEIKEYKVFFKKRYQCYTGVADIYVYFYEQGFKLLRKNGVLCYITSNKYMRAGYGEKLRAFLADNASVCELIDFGDAPVFEATAYPSILLLKNEKASDDRIKALSWKRGAPVADFERVVKSETFLIPRKALSDGGWRREPPAVLKLLEKLQKTGKPLGNTVKGRFYRGLLTGLNEAFVIDRTTRDRLIAEHSSSAEVLKPFLRGRDVKCWRVNFSEQYLIKIESSENKRHPWSNQEPKEAERILTKTYPAISSHLMQHREKLIKRDDQGKYFWELRSCKYWQEFEQPKIVYPDIAQRAEFAYDRNGFFLANTLYLIPTKQLWLVGILNSTLMFWSYTKISSQIRGNFVRYIAQYVSQIPIATGPDNEQIESLVKQILKNKTAYPATDVTALEREIDRRVYLLYGLTDDEIRIVEGEK